MFKVFTLISFCCFYLAPASVEGLQCYSCRGINCLRTTTQNKFEICEDNLDTCVTIFEKFAVTAKGCLMTIAPELKRKCNDINNLECQMCTGDLCNTMGRSDYKCYQCDERDKNSKNCAGNLDQITPTQCLAPTSPNSYCYTKTNEGFTMRGCSLNVRDQLECLNDGACTLCLVDDGEGCNSQKMAVAGASKISSTVALLLLFVSVMNCFIKF